MQGKRRFRIASISAAAGLLAALAIGVATKKKCKKKKRKR